MCISFVEYVATHVWLIAQKKYFYYNIFNILINNIFIIIIYINMLTLTNTETISRRKYLSNANNLAVTVYIQV